MPDDPRVEQLLEDLLDSGGTPEEACVTCPELLPQVRSRWQKLRSVRAEVGAMFPPSPVFGHVTATPLPADYAPRISGYEVQEVLGRGGVGVVYKAWHLRLNRAVALKMLLTGPYAGPGELERFLREAETVAGLRHPNIVQVHEAGDVDGRPYFTMEFVEGGSLAQRLRGTPQPARQAAALVAAVAEGIHAAHQRGVVHRDLKPGNILLTADGTPKISDFGLARRLEGAAGLTQSGAPVGTPSYMAPEQAEGKSRHVGSAADTYALGAILYELLTGRPPFRADTAAETLRQVISQAAVPPSHLNFAVPRDVETICLKCLEKHPGRRYPSASALAEDLHCFQRNEPIVARRMGMLERVLRWIRRNPTGTALIVTVLALGGLALGGGGWLVQQRVERQAELRNEVGTALAQVATLRKRFHFQEAWELLKQTRQGLGATGPEDLRREAELAQADLQLAEHLDTARLPAATIVKGRLEIVEAEAPFERAFAEAGLGRPGDDSEIVAARVRGSAVRLEIVAALDDWASITHDQTRREWLLAVARRADPDLSRDRLRQPGLWKNGPALTKLVQELQVNELSPQLASALGRVLRNTGGDGVPLLSAAQVRFPQDVWLNLELGLALSPAQRWDEALSYYRAALALRPDSGVVYNNLGNVLYKKAQLDDAISHYQQALRLDPKFAVAHQNLGVVLNDKGRREEAIGQLQQAIRLDPNFANSHYNLGAILFNKDRLDEAILHFEEAIRLDPKGSAGAHNYLGLALWSKDRLDEAAKHFRESIRLDPQTSAAAHTNLGKILRLKGWLDEAIGQFQQAVQLDPNLNPARQDLYTCRYSAACAAIQASSGAGRTRSGERDRVDLRQQALERLQANLDFRARLLKEGKVVNWSLSAWQTEPALASVRDQPALANLPEAERTQWQRLWAEVAILAADPLQQGPAHAARRDWAKAAACYARASEPGSTRDGHFWFEYAAVLLLSGDRSGYARVCAGMIERYGKMIEQHDKPSPNLRAYHVARACTLAPDAVAQASLPERLAESELKNYGGQFWSLTEQGALQYRAGRFSQAVNLFEQSLRADTKPGRAVLNWLWLALANHRLGKSDDARRWLDKATAWLDQCGEGMPARAEQNLGLDLHNWLEANILRREAEMLILRAPLH